MHMVVVGHETAVRVLPSAAGSTPVVQGDDPALAPAHGTNATATAAGSMSIARRITCQG
jgi:hypothetical protein